jgi:phosphotransferase system enzyme I (PtsI)
VTKREGIAASDGIAIGPAFVYRPEIPESEEHTVDDPDGERREFDAAAAAVAADLDELRAHVSSNIDAEQAEIFEMQREFLDDPSFVGEIRELISSDALDAVSATKRVTADLVEEFKTIEDEYFLQRADDIRDVSTRLVRKLLGLGDAGLSALPRESIIVARDLSPSDTATMDVKKTLALCTETGSATSHTAIISRSLGVPSVVGVGEVDELEDDTRLIIDGTEGLLIVDPDEDTLAAYREKRKQWETERQRIMARAAEPVTTTDGLRVEVVANAGSPAEARRAAELGAEGIGLLRTEFLFLDRETLPDEDEQYGMYREILEPFPRGPVVIRTLDVGGDKNVPAITMPSEQNPFLGRRGIRLSRAQPEVFRTQIRAILRAAVGRNVKIMFPLVATLGDFEAGREQVEIARTELAERGAEFNPDCELGVMIEVPSAAVNAPQLARHVDFFSIGTNDLTQYTLAVDRTNELVAELADPFDPAVLHLIARTIDAAHEQGKWAGMCGEMAGDPLALPLLLGLGLDEFSMAGGRVPRAKAALRQLAARELVEPARTALTLATAREVRDHLARFTAVTEEA